MNHNIRYAWIIQVKDSIYKDVQNNAITWDSRLLVGVEIVKNTIENTLTQYVLHTTIYKKFRHCLKENYQTVKAEKASSNQTNDNDIAKHLIIKHVNFKKNWYKRLFWMVFTSRFWIENIVATKRSGVVY